jgi:hypothetical protein
MTEHASMLLLHMQANGPGGFIVPVPEPEDLTGFIYGIAQKAMIGSGIRMVTEAVLDIINRIIIKINVHSFLRMFMLSINKLYN